ncbi:MAG: 30S ribosomal protein S19e [Candidatus Thermoplasmatota archaeon]|jgi:small subunit ribosomal protein S19e|nr:30S ribosomal protein S19e [Cuniculiplasma sp.]MCL4319679.1 30S ribosomal protein S19e [Candidatus Thermoplasmatota archaeon]MCL6015428.1 30S ribosomal protein S19e [Candidatus Thermoplasmatota archaeon]
MVNVKEVPADLLIEKLTEEFSKNDKIKVPEWAEFLKSGVHREKSWVQEDWYYRRLASTLRKVYVRGNIGIQRLSEEYGGKKDGGSKPYHPASGSRSIVRHVLNELQDLGLLVKKETGRSVSPGGEAMLQKASKQVMESLSEKQVELKKYL